MTGLTWLASLWRNLFHRTRVERDLDDELHTYVDQLMDEKIRGGMSPAEARRAATMEAGGVEQMKEEVRDAMVTRTWDLLRRDVRHAARSLARSPGFTLVAVLCLALGIGANTTVFGVVDALLFRPPAHVRDPGSVVRVYFTRADREGGYATSSITNYPNYEDVAGSTGVFAQVAAYWPTQTTLGRGPEARPVQASLVSGSFFPLLGARPLLGRFIGPEDERGSAGDHVAVLSYGLWRRAFSGGGSPLGATLRIGRSSYTVIGVAPPGFTGPDPAPVDVWLPVRALANDLMGDGALTSRNSYWINVLGRLRAGVAPASAAAAATMALRRGNAADAHGDTSTTAELYPINRDRGPKMSERARASLWVAAGAAAVLLIACANLAGLLLARNAARWRELAVRLALGAGRSRLAAQLLVETLLLSAVGGGFGVALALWGGGALRAALLPDIGPAATVLSARVLAFTAATALVAAGLSGILPALTAGRADLASSLKSAGRSHTPRSSRGQSVLVVAQVAVTLVLLVGAELFVGSLKNLEARVGGLAADHLLVVTTDAEALGLGKADISLLYERMRDGLKRVPGVEDASAAVFMPLSSSGACCLDNVAGLEQPASITSGPYIFPVGPEWFGTAGTKIVEGRSFTAADRVGAPMVAVLNATMARAYWPRGGAVGKCLNLTDPAGGAARCAEIVGVAEDVVRINLRDQRDAGYYVPLDQFTGSYGAPWTPSYLLVRATGSPSAIVSAVRRALGDAAPDMPDVTIQPLEDSYGWLQLRPLRLGVTMFGAFAILGLVLAAVGIYGLLSFLASRRTAELAVRMALGAPARRVRWLMVRQGLRLAVVGAAIGVLCAIALGRALASLLYGISPSNPALLALAVMVLLGIAVAASYVPARRATRLDPSIALRAE